MKKITLFFIGFMFFFQLSYGQKVTVTGKVTAKEDGLPIIGASVMEKGNSNGTVTNFDGVYTLGLQWSNFGFQLCRDGKNREKIIWLPRY